MWFNLPSEEPMCNQCRGYLAPLTIHARRHCGKCGHETTLVHDEIYPKAINVFFEYFPDGGFHPAKFLDLRKSTR